MLGTLTGALNWFRRHPLPGWILLVLYAVVVTFPHENVQTVVASLIGRFGRSFIYKTAGGIAVALALAVTVLLVSALRKNPQVRVVSRYFAATLVLIVCTWRWLSVNNTELVHYPQYFVPGMILFALTGSAAETLCWIVIIGGLDEDFQYWGLHGAWGVPFDFNDVFMDLLGGTLGMLFAVALLANRVPVTENLSAFWSRTIRRPGVSALLGIVLTMTVLWASGKVLLYKDTTKSYWFALSRQIPTGLWFYDPTWGPRTIHTLSPLEGPALILLTITIFAWIDRRISLR